MWPHQSVTHLLCVSDDVDLNSVASIPGMGIPEQLKAAMELEQSSKSHPGTRWNSAGFQSLGGNCCQSIWQLFSELISLFIVLSNKSVVWCINYQNLINVHSVPCFEAVGIRFHSSGIWSVFFQLSTFLCWWCDLVYLWSSDEDLLTNQCCVQIKRLLLRLRCPSLVWTGAWMRSWEKKPRRSRRRRSHMPNPSQHSSSR